MFLEDLPRRNEEVGEGEKGGRTKRGRSRELVLGVSFQLKKKWGKQYRWNVCV